MSRQISIIKENLEDGRAIWEIELTMMSILVNILGVELRHFRIRVKEKEKRRGRVLLYGHVSGKPKQTNSDWRVSDIQRYPLLTIDALKT